MASAAAKSRRARNRLAAKAAAQRSHAFRRAAQRYNTWLTGEDFVAITHLITTNKARNVERQSNTRSIYSVKYEGTHYYVVYDKTTKEIATLLTPEQGRTHELPRLSEQERALEEEKTRG